MTTPNEQRLTPLLAFLFFIVVLVLATTLALAIVRPSAVPVVVPLVYAVARLVQKFKQ